MSEHLEDKSSIQFYSEEIEFELPLEKHKIISWLNDIASREGKQITFINYVFCSDAYLHNMNMTYLNQDSLTDIITFPYTSGNYIESDIYISIQRIKENSVLHEADFQVELLRVIVHGLLHLCGYPDKSPKEAKIMRSKENEFIALFQNQFLTN